MAAAVAGMLGGAVPAAGTAHAGGDASLNGTDPRAGGCAAAARTTTVLPLPGPESGMPLSVRHAPGCGTNWIELTNPYPDGTVTVVLTIAAGGTTAYSRSGDHTGLHRSAQVFAPGRRCVAVGAGVYRAGRLVTGGGPLMTVC